MPRESDRLPDWFVGGAGKRRLLSAVVRGGPERTWTEKELTVASGLSPKNTIRRHLAALVQAGVLTGAPGAYRLNASSPILTALGSMLEQLDEMPDDPLPASRGGSPRRSPT